MRVAVDARTVYSPTRRGTGKNLVDLYTTLAALHPPWEFLMLHQSERTPDEPFGGLSNVRARYIDIRGDRYNLWQDVRLPLAAARARASVLHCPANTAPVATLTPTVVTIHDLIPLEISPGTPETERWERRVRRGARYARHVLTPSEYSRRGIAERFGLPPDRITVNYWAPDRGAVRASPDAIASVRARYGIPQGFPYMLAFGGEDPRKNTKGIIEAWTKLPSQARQSSRLVIVGLQQHALVHFRELARTRVPDDSCILHGFAPEEDVSPLMSGACALCYPSLSEGFGLPVVDAFACGTPVITSTTTSLPEIAGDAALLVDPSDVDGIAEAIMAMLSSDSLRQRLEEAGRRRLPLFSWERCARTVAHVLSAAAAQ
jgi:glycosyltransferase involved in cell wall biosynthesis